MDLVAPIVPDAQKNKSPEILLEGLRTGLAAFAQFANIRRQSESDLAKLALQERLAQEEHDLDTRKLDMAAEMIPYEKAAKEAETDLKTEHAKAWASGTATAAQQKIEFNRQREALINDVNKSAGDLKLNDVKFATENPVQFAANVLHFEDMYQFSPAPEVKNAIRQYRTIADQQKISLKKGVTSEDGIIKGEGEGVQVPIWQVVKRMQDPSMQEQTMMDLEASGHTRITEGFTTMTGRDGKPVQVPTKTTEPSPLIKKYLQTGKDVNFAPVPSRVPATTLPSSAAAGTTPTASGFEATDTDAIIAKAKAAVANGAPIDAVSKRLEELGIDPNVLSE